LRIKVQETRLTLQEHDDDADIINLTNQPTNDGLKLNGTHQLPAYADDVNILGGSIHTVRENAEALVAAAREIGLAVSADKTEYLGHVWRSECRTNSQCED